MKFMKVVVVSIIMLMFSTVFGKSDTQVIDKTKSFISTAAAKIDTAVSNTKTVIVDGVHKTDTSSTFRQIYYDIKDGVVALAKGLKTTAEHVFTVLVKQQYMLGALDLVKLLVLIFILWRFYKYLSNKEKIPEWNLSIESDIYKFAFFTFSSIVVYLSFTVYLPSIFQRFINPEYPVYLQVIDIVKQLRN